jgi:hypothetical protein
VLELGCADAFVSFDDAGIDASVAGPGGNGPVRLDEHHVTADVHVVELAMHIGHVPTLVGAPMSCRRRIPVIRQRVGLSVRWRGGGLSGLMGRGDER